MRPYRGSALRISLLTTLAIFGTLIAVIATGGALQWAIRPLPNSRYILATSFFLLALFVFFRGYRSREWDAMAPVRLFYAAWFGLLGLGSLRLTAIEPPFTLRFWATVTSGLCAFYLGARWAQRQRNSSRRIPLETVARDWKFGWSAKRALWITLLLFAVCSLAFLYEYRTSGLLPLLAPDPNWARFNFAANSYVHRFAISLYLVIPLAYLGAVHFRRYRLVFGATGVLACAGLLLLTGRVFLLSGFWMCIILFHYTHRRMTPKVLLAVALICYPLATVVVNTSRFYDNPSFMRILDRIDFPERLRSVSPDYLAFTLTLQTLDNLTYMIPNEMKFTHGWYIAYPIRVFWTPREGGGFRGRLDDLLWQPSKEWSPIPAVTASYMGVPYADFGILGVFVYSCIFGWLAMRAYNSMRAKPTFWRIFVYSQLSFAIVLSLYGSYLTLMDVYWNLAAIRVLDHFGSV